MQPTIEIGDFFWYTAEIWPRQGDSKDLREKDFSEPEQKELDELNKE